MPQGELATQIQPLVPLPVAGAFNRVGVDVVQFVPSHSGNKYAIVFIDYLTKWVEVFNCVRPYCSHHSTVSS